MSDKETMEQKLLRVVVENPGLKILPCVDYDVCCDDSFSWWIGKITSVEVKTRVYYYPGDYAEYDHVFFDEDDEDDIKDMIGSSLDIENSNDEYENIIHQKYLELKREKVIALKIGV